MKAQLIKMRPVSLLLIIRQPDDQVNLVTEQTGGELKFSTSISRLENSAINTTDHSISTARSHFQETLLLK